LKWIEWSKKIQAIAQNGLTYAKDQFDIERYKQLQDIAADIISTYTNHDFQVVKNYLRNETGYATPKIDVRGVVFKENKILLVKEKIDRLWTLPGGWADVLESPSENVEREVLEESGYKTQAVRLLAVYDRSRHNHFPEYPSHVYKMFFLCKIISGGPRKGMETLEVDFFGRDVIPDLSKARVTYQQIQRMFYLRETDITEFD
jgi:ADP-ribose pyrophosphatase YjhB (NUDIX family)